MRRKLINWEAFDRIQKDSLSAAEHELLEASDVLARALGVDQLELTCFGESNVVYETLDGTYVRADYDVSQDHLTLENIEELVIDEDSAAQASRKKVADMVEAILSNENEKASQLFSEYMTSPAVRRALTEGRKEGTARPFAEKKKAANTKHKTAFTSRVKERKRKLDTVKLDNGPRQKRNTNKGPKDNPNYFKDWAKKAKQRGYKRKTIDAKGKIQKVKFMKECYALSENVLEFVAFQQLGPVLSESVVKRDNLGNVVAIRMPTVKLRNENRILTLNHRHQLDTDVKVIREQALGLSRDMTFCKAVAELKRHNNISDSDGLQECLSAIVGQWPSVLYLTQTELSQAIAESLDVIGVSNYDDQTCAFMAEGLLRTAHEVFGDKVERLLRLAQADVKVEGDNYLHFQNVAHRFFPTLDESHRVQMQVFNDLFNAVNQVWEDAHNVGDTAVVQDAEEILETLSLIVNGEASADIDLAEEVAEWLHNYVEGNLDVNGDWNVSNTPHQTVNGDHPDMEKKARQGYAPASDLGTDANAWQSRASEKQVTGQKWTSVGDSDVFPSLNNPYVPKSGDYTMSGEKGVDKDWQNGEGTWQSNDTWPNLQNPYVPKAETPKSYQNNGSETDLGVNK